MEEMKKAIVAEPYKHLQKDISYHVAKSGRFEVIDCVESLSELVERAVYVHYDAIFIDYPMQSDMDVPTAVKLIREVDRRSFIYLVSDELIEQGVLEQLTIGCLPKEGFVATLNEVIKKI